MSFINGVWCKNCQHPIPSDSNKTPQLDGVLCFGCQMQTKVERTSAEGSQWSYLLNRWAHEAQRVLHFLREDRLAPEVTTILCTFAKSSYMFHEIVHMANSMAMERIRHKSPNGIRPSRFVVRSDFEDALTLAKNIEFLPPGAEAITTLELLAHHLTIDQYGFIRDNFFPPKFAYCSGVCRDGPLCKNFLPIADRILCTEAYRLRKGCNMIYVGVPEQDTKLITFE
ncbi:hypothetical protein F5Y11DRAFT_327683 [Daldinia sp. FL1419]|nr:hypothetical protein F5Y11DRAFT_327683 [Daldinia sp. FL1419]